MTRDTEESKIFPVEAFGYRRITIERPLQLNFQASPERIERIDDEKPVQKLDETDRKTLHAACARLDPDKRYLSRKSFTRDLKAAFKAEGTDAKAPLLKALLNALSDRDPEAEICIDKKGNPEPDSGLRDYENVPLGESVYEYFEHEVKPHVPDAWIDESKCDALDGEVGIVGFEIPFNRHFYKFTPPRPLEEIDADLKACTDRIKQMIEEMSA